MRALRSPELPRGPSIRPMLKKLLGLAGVGALLVFVLACGFGGGGDDDDGDDDDDFAARVAIVSTR
jgi:hypothetical protein